MIKKYSMEDYRPYADALAKKAEVDRKLLDSEGLLDAAKKRREEAEEANRELMELEADAILGGKSTGHLKDKSKEARRKAEEADKAAGEAEHITMVLKVGLEKINREVAEKEKEAREQLIKVIRKDHEAAVLPLIEAARRLSEACAKEKEVREAAADAMSWTWSVTSCICPVHDSINPGQYDDNYSKLGALVEELRKFGYAGI